MQSMPLEGEEWLLACWEDVAVREGCRHRTRFNGEGAEIGNGVHDRVRMIGGLLRGRRKLRWAKGANEGSV
jgi:hypothetical protein